MRRREKLQNCYKENGSLWGMKILKVTWEKSVSLYADQQGFGKLLVSAQYRKSKLKIKTNWTEHKDFFSCVIYLIGSLLMITKCIYCCHTCKSNNVTAFIMSVVHWEQLQRIKRYGVRIYKSPVTVHILLHIVNTNNCVVAENQLETRVLCFFKDEYILTYSFISIDYINSYGLNKTSI